MTKQKTEHEDTGQSMKTQHGDAANIPPLLPGPLRTYYYFQVNRPDSVF